MYLNDKIADSGQKIVDLFADNFSKSFSSHVANSHEPNETLSKCNNNCIGSIRFTEREILNKIRQLDESKGPGPDGIPPLFVKRCGSALALPLSLIFNRSLCVGEFPDEFKKGKIVPLHKKGSAEDIKNYRPISMLSCFSKLFEALVCPPLSRHLKHLLSEQQHGFIKGRSTETNLAVVVSELSKEVDKGRQIDAVYTDFSSAFDKVCHTLLIKKLENIGIHGSFLNWFKSYLKKRQQVVCVNDFESESFIATSGVPQGSHLGPILFLIFINDIVCRIKFSNVKMFADDLKIYRVIETATDGILLQNDIDSIKSWCDENRMHLNTQKCFYIKYTRKKKPINTKYILDGTFLQEVNEIRDLGVVIDSGLTFRSHIDTIAKKAAQLLGFIRRNSKKFKHPNTKVLLYNSLVRSHLEYASVVWNPFYSIHSQRIEGLQRAFTRSLAFSSQGISHRSPYENRLKFFKMHTLRDRRKIRDLIFLHKVIQGSSDCPSILNEVCLHVPHRYPRHRICRILDWQQVARTNLARNSPLHRVCRSYNEVNASSDSLDIFNDKLAVFKHKLVSTLRTSL